MKHPEREEWIPYLFGEADSEAKKKLARHLNTCPECAEEIRAWRQSLRQLDSWKAPQGHRRTFAAVNPCLNLAAAALLVLGIGFGLGRWLAPRTKEGQSPANLEAAIKASLVPELRQQVRQELANEWETRLAQLRQESSAALARAKTDAVEASAADTAQALEEVVALMRSERSEDQQNVADLGNALRKQHENDFVSLRKDLETVATTADDRIRAAQLKLIELATVSPASER